MRYIDIRTIAPDTYQVWLGYDGTDTVVLRDGQKVDFDRRPLNLKVRKGYKPPNMFPGTFTRDEAINIAHRIGNYIFRLGDLVYTYTTVDGLRNIEFFE